MSRMKLKDIAVEKNERVDNPSQSPYEIFVGLEHYDSGEATIRRYGSTERLESTMKVFQAGDILIARRNVYLKRAATVNFKGLTSGDSIVLHIDNELYRRIVPFVLNTDDFWSYANQHADGTMSKRLSPKLLMEYEFSLPDENLERVSDLLWAMERVKKAYRDLITRTDELVKSQFIEMSNKWKNEYNYEPLSNVINSITYGFTNPMPDTNEGPWKVTAKDIVNGRIDYSTARKTSRNEYDKLTAKSKPTIGDILLTKDGTLGRVAIVEREDVCINQSVAAIKCNERVFPKFLANMLQMTEYQNKMMADAGGVTVKHLYITRVDKMLVCIPNLLQQQEWTEFLDQIDKSKFAAHEALKELTNAQKALMKKIFK